MHMLRTVFSSTTTKEEQEERERHAGKTGWPFRSWRKKADSNGRTDSCYLEASTTIEAVLEQRERTNAVRQRSRNRVVRQYSWSKTAFYDVNAAKVPAYPSNSGYGDSCRSVRTLKSLQLQPRHHVPREYAVLFCGCCGYRVQAGETQPLNNVLVQIHRRNPEEKS